MATYVLVAGAWLGGWAWQPVTQRLREHGHDVHPVTLTGLGERADLAGPEVDLDTYLADVAGLMEVEDLHDVILVGHSYAGHLITGVADRLPERISLLAYLDAGPSPDGAAFMDLQPPAARELIERLARLRGEAREHAVLGEVGELLEGAPGQIVDRKSHVSLQWILLMVSDAAKSTRSGYAMALRRSRGQRNLSQPCSRWT